MQTQKSVRNQANHEPVDSESAYHQQANKPTNSQTVPPWIWVWLFAFIVFTLPYYLNVWFVNVAQLALLPSADLGTVVNRVYQVQGLAGLLELIPSLSVLIGLLLLLRPQFRATKLEAEYNLKAVSNPSPVLKEILDFIHQRAPDIKVKVNRIRFDRTAFVYAMGRKRTAIAVFGQLIKQWRADQPTAEAVLEHELTHYRHGDALIIGAGSPFRAVIERWGKLYRWLFLGPFLLGSVGLTLLLFYELNQLRALGIGGGGFITSFVVHLVEKTGLMLSWGLFITVGLVLWTISIFISPIAAIWCSELNADQASIKSTGLFAGTGQSIGTQSVGRKAAERQSTGQNTKTDHTAALAALAQIARRPTLRKWILSWLTHPPYALRRWMLMYPSSTLRKFLLLLIFPAACGLKILFLNLSKAWFLISGVSGVSIEHVASLQTLAALWLISALVLAAWPLLAKVWEGLFCEYSTQIKMKSLPYLLCAVLLTVLSAVALSYAD